MDTARDRRDVARLALHRPGPPQVNLQQNRSQHASRTRSQGPLRPVRASPRQPSIPIRVVPRHIAHEVNTRQTAATRRLSWPFSSVGQVPHHVFGDLWRGLGLHRQGSWRSVAVVRRQSVVVGVHAQCIVVGQGTGRMGECNSRIDRSLFEGCEKASLDIRVWARLPERADRGRRVR